MNSNRFHTSRSEREIQHAAKWARRRDIPIAILAWLILGGLIIWASGYIIRSLLAVTIAALLAFALTPAVKFLERFMPRILAVIIVYLVVLSGISFLLYEIVNTTIGQVSALVTNLQKLLADPKQLGSITNFFRRFGITADQLRGMGQAIEQQATGIVGGALPLLSGIANFMLDVVIVAVLSIYLLLDGGRAVSWLRRNAPVVQRERIHFFLDTLERVIGGYIRGQLIMSSTIGLLVGIGMALFGVPYAVLLGVVAFILEFIPIIGTILSGALCVLIAFSHGWLIALFVLLYFIVVHILEGDILAPRIVGRAVGVHPAVSLFALLAGAELFGIWGAVLGSPLAGLIQAVLVTVWQDWRENHPEQFPEDEEEGENLEQEEEESEKPKTEPKKIIRPIPEKMARPGPTVEEKKL
jgi:predicted PurR-regulated permease PerM